MYKEFNLENVKEVYGRLKTLTDDYNYKNFEVAFLIMERLGNIEDGEQITENLIKKVEEIAENSESLVSDYCIEELEELEELDEELEEEIYNTKIETVYLKDLYNDSLLEFLDIRTLNNDWKIKELKNGNEIGYNIYDTENDNYNFNDYDKQMVSKEKILNTVFFRELEFFIEEEDIENWAIDEGIETIDNIFNKFIEIGKKYGLLTDEQEINYKNRYNERTKEVRETLREENIENIEKAIEEIEKEIEYEKKKQDICGYGSGDMAYLMELEEKLEELQEKLEEL